MVIGVINNLASLIITVAISGTIVDNNSSNFGNNLRSGQSLYALYFKELTMK